MPLTRWARLGLAVVGVLLVTVGGVGAALNWSGVALTSFIVGGIFLLIGAIVGVVPRGSIKDGSLEWPEVDKHPRVEKIEGDLATLREELTVSRKETTKTSDLLLDYILAHEPVPADGMTDAERLDEFERAVAELSSEVDGRHFTGETYDDGIDVTELERYRYHSARDLAREERRQAARARFGLSAPREVD
jgi:hypothetical protein